MARNGRVVSRPLIATSSREGFPLWCAMGRLDRCLGGISKGIGGDDRAAAFCDDIAPGLDICARKTHHQGNIDIQFTASLHDALGHPIATVDSRERIEQNRLDVAVGQHQRNAAATRSGDSTRTANKKFGRQAIHLVPSSDSPPPGTIMWTCRWRVIAEPKVCSTEVMPTRAPKCFGSAAIVIIIS
jgi:hypothetical protein